MATRRVRKRADRQVPATKQAAPSRNTEAASPSATFSALFMFHGSNLGTSASDARELAAVGAAKGFMTAHQVVDSLESLLGALSSRRDTPDTTPAPPTLVTTAGCDPLRTDGTHYVARLVDADIKVTYLPFPHLVHGWLELAEASASAGEAQRLLIEAVGTLRDSTVRRPAVGRR
ncbi:alpha/beta hydrolase fold domain-containing protein [Rhodococcus sovatensis]|uniref:Alpha/beta hydrolase fold domain-containing protein n=1 Tax=Rhodococcus sovatensis TaxID=1805840 RepID=A0ABZ2PIB1_9NOCA